MKITQHFTWEAAHRHLHHAPRDLHRHAYRLTVELEGVPARPVVCEIVERVLRPLVDAWRDAVLVGAEDERLQQEVRRSGWKHAVLPGGTTAEHLSQYVIDYFCMMAASELRLTSIEAVLVRLEADAGQPGAQIPHKACARAYLRADRYGSLKGLTPKAAAYSLARR